MTNPRKVKAEERQVLVPIAWIEGLLQALEDLENKRLPIKYLIGFVQSAETLLPKQNK